MRVLLLISELVGNIHRLRSLSTHSLVSSLLVSRLSSFLVSHLCRLLSLASLSPLSRSLSFCAGSSAECRMEGPLATIQVLPFGFQGSLAFSCLAAAVASVALGFSHWQLQRACPSWQLHRGTRPG